MRQLYHIILSIALLFGSVTSLTSQITESDVSLIMRTFDSKPVSEIIVKADQLISTGKDSAQSAMIASSIFEYYYSSSIMGYDSVALYIADHYFLNGKYEWPNEEGYLLLKIFAEFNRLSMIGREVPELSLSDSLGYTISVEKIKGKYKILYFYDDQCQTCKRETPLLLSFLNDLGENNNIVFFRVFTQNDRRRWMTYLKDNPAPSNILCYDLWDPEYDSDFQKKYAVLSTPQMFLINSDNIIVGRNLNTDALSQLYFFYEEAAIRLQQLFTGIFEAEEAPQPETLIDLFWDKARNNKPLFQEVFFELYQYLKKGNNYDFQRAAIYLGEKYIVGMPEMWSDFSIMEPKFMIEETALAIELFKRNELGNPVTNLFLEKPNGKIYSIYKNRSKFTILYFYSLDCPLCEATSLELKQLITQYKKKGITILAINTGTEKELWKKEARQSKKGWIDLIDSKGTSEMFSLYDLSNVPTIYLLDNNKITIAKDLTPFALKELLNSLL